MNCFKKVFICEINVPKAGNSQCDVIKTIMKSSVFGVITGIQKFSRKTIYTVDDGTGSLDCVLWHNESASIKQMDTIINKLNSRSTVSASSVMNSDSDDICKLLLNKIQVNDEEEINYLHGDTICCLGIVKLVRGKLLLNITHHYKANTINTETLWILDVLSSRKYQ